MPPIIGRYRLVSVRCAIEWQFLNGTLLLKFELGFSECNGLLPSRGIAAGTHDVDAGGCDRML